jgi:hypothetical protein
LPLENSTQICLVDANIAEELLHHKWWFIAGYIRRSIHRSSRDSRFLYDLIIKDKPKGKMIDHKNRIKWDNRLCNLRVANDFQSGVNKGKDKNPHTSKYKGVSWIKSYGKWKVQVCAHGVKYSGGCFTDEVEAAKKANELLRKHHGDFAYQNEIP